MANRETIYKTRYQELGYAHLDTNLWRFVDLIDGGTIFGACTGPHYRTKAELLADLDRYAREFGCEGAKWEDPADIITALVDAYDTLQGTDGATTALDCSGTYTAGQWVADRLIGPIDRAREFLNSRKGATQ